MPDTRQAERPGDGLLIFDCDGVLVDSEVISAEVVAEVLHEAGVTIPVEHVYRDFLGRSMDTMRAIIDRDHGFAIGESELASIRARMQRRLRRELRPIPGIAKAIGRLSLARCVASSSRPERIRLSLEMTGLYDFFAPNIFSATMVKDGKPAPDLFLHAAKNMGYAPTACVVVEDSPAGVEAAKRAGMRVYAFVGGTHATPSRLKDALADMRPDVIFDDMLRLPELLSEEAEFH
jgi:HAD superfamily hydrolase (TIGR01509 family)